MEPQVWKCQFEGEPEWYSVKAKSYRTAAYTCCNTYLSAEDVDDGEDIVLSVYPEEEGPGKVRLMEIRARKTLEFHMMNK